MLRFIASCIMRWSSFIPLSWLFLCISEVVVVAAWSEPRIVSGQRCLLVSSQTTPSTNTPLVLIGGLAQTISSYESHLPTLSKERNVLVYECRGQGVVQQQQEEESAMYANVTLSFQAERLFETVNEVFGEDCQFDLVGFSLGGRIAMAAACLDNNDEKRIQRLHVTGVATERSIQGKVALVAWKELVGNDNLQGFAWNALQITYSSEFLYRNQQRLPMWIEFLCKTNSCAGIQALLQQTHPEDSEDPWHVSSMARRLTAGKRKIKGQLVVGELDVMAPPDKAEELAAILGWPAPTIIPNCGHAVPMEAGREWRTSVLHFLNYS